MSWEDIVKMAYQGQSPKMFPSSEKCFIKKCDATTCRHNSIHTGKVNVTTCTLPNVEISSKAECKMYSPVAEVFE